MKIVGLVAENIKRLVAVEIAPTGALVKITGRNAAGKSSVLDAIWWALCGAKHIQAAPIRKGADKARIRLDLGEIIVTRTFGLREDEQITTTLTVENAQGARFPSAQKVLDDLVGALSMDPLKFMKAEPPDQLAMLRAFVPGVDFAAIEKANKIDFDKRTELNRQAKALRAQAAGITVPAGAPTEAVDETALIAELENAGEHNTRVAKAKQTRATEQRDIENSLKEEQHLQVQIEELQSLLADKQKARSQWQARLHAEKPLPEPIDTADVRKRIEAARETNAQVAARQKRAKIETEADAIAAKAVDLTCAIENRRLELTKAIEAAALPVPGLALGDGEVLLNGLPLDQASDAEQLRTSVAIAMAMNPKLRVLRVRDGSLLDDAALKLLGAMATEKDFQVWIELVDTSGKVGFVIEDGAVKARPVSEAAE